MAYARDSDLWSLGAAATLVHVATGHRTFEAKSDTLWCFAVAGDMDAAAPSVLRLPRPRRAQPATAAASARPPAFDPVLYGRPARALLVASHALAALARARFDNNLALASDQRDGAGGPRRRGGDAGPHRRRLGDRTADDSEMHGAVYACVVSKGEKVLLRPVSLSSEHLTDLVREQ